MIRNARLAIEQTKIHRLVNQLIDPSCIPSWPIRDMQTRNVVIIHLQPTDTNIGLQITLVPSSAPILILAERIRPSTQLTSRFQEIIPLVRVREFFEDKEARETCDTDDGSFVYL